MSVSNVTVDFHIMVASVPNPQASSSLQLKEIQELSIAINAAKLNPTMLSEDFLKASGIVPNDWELNKQPVLSPNYAQVSFQNGVSIVTQPRTITFLEMVGNKEPDTLKVSEIAQKYIEKLPLAEYQGLSVSPKSVVPLSGGTDAAQKYITGTLLAPGPWLEFGNAPVQAGLNLLYQLAQCQFSLSINEARLQLPDNTAIPALLFAGSFNYNITSNSDQERVQKIIEGIKQWRSDLESFREIVNQRFLAQQASLFPEITIPPAPVE